MNICLINVAKTRFPNLALMKIAAYHRSLGDSVEWADPMFGNEEFQHLISGGMFPETAIDTKQFLEDYFKIDLTI